MTGVREGGTDLDKATVSRFVPNFLRHILHEGEIENANVEGTIEGERVVPVASDTCCV